MITTITVNIKASPPDPNDPGHTETYYERYLLPGQQQPLDLEINNENPIQIKFVNNIIQTSTNSEVPYSIIISDLNGKQIYNSDEIGDVYLNLGESLPNYFLISLVTNNNVYTKKIVRR